MAIVSFTGTRLGMTSVQASVFEGLITDVEEFHHGSCEGADVEAARIVGRSFGVKPHIVAHPGPDGDPHRGDSGVDDEVRPPKTHLARNREMVDLADVVYACPPTAEEQPRGGTWYTVRYARKKGKKLYIITPDGGILE